MIDVTTAIVTHPQRRTMAEDLRNKLMRWYPSVLMSVDEAGVGCTANHIETWRRLADLRPDTPWTMVIEDDAILAPDLGRHLSGALHRSPAPVVSPYLGTGRPEFAQPAVRRAVSQNRPYVVHSRLLHCVAVCVRTGLIHEMCDGIESIHRQIDKPIDELITEWLRSACIPVAYTNPSLVDHADQATVTSHDWSTPVRRVAHHFGVRDSWSGGFSII